MMHKENDTPTYTQYFPFAFCYYGTAKYLQFNGGGSLVKYHFCKSTGQQPALFQISS